MRGRAGTLYVRANGTPPGGWNVGGQLNRALIIGRGRAGTSFERALTRAGWVVSMTSGRDLPASIDTDLVLLAVPDRSVADVASRLEPTDALICHLAGSLGLSVLAPHARVASLHPLVALPGDEAGADRLAGAWMVTAGDPAIGAVAGSLGGRPLTIDDSERVRYHATAVIASNHVVALMGQVSRLAEGLGLPLQPFLDLARAAIDNVGELGAERALTGPVSRGDWDTVSDHLAALPESERAAYTALSQGAARLTEEVAAS